MNHNGNGNGRGRTTPQLRCAAYTRKSTEEGLQQDFNSLDAQRESAEAYIASQKSEGWICLPDRYDDGGFTGGNLERPALQRLLADIEKGKVDAIIVYKVDRISRSLIDFSKIMDVLERHRVAFVSVTQQFNTSTSMGRLMLNVLLSFAQFERELVSERTRDKIAAARRKGKWMGGKPLLGYDLLLTPGGGKLIVNEDEAARVRAIYDLYIERESLIRTCQALNERGWTTKRWTARKGHECGGKTFDKTTLFRLLTNVVYRGQVRYRDEVHAGEHDAIVGEDIWTRVQQMLRSNGRTGGMHIRNKYGALLKGLLHCKPCNRAMMHSYTIKGNRCYRYYTCSTAMKQGWHACPSKSVPAEEIERFVVDQVRGIGKEPAVLAMVLDQARGQSTEEIAALEIDARTAEREISRVHAELKSVAVDAATNAHAAVRLAELHERLGDAEQRLTNIREQIERGRRNVVTKHEVDSALNTFTPLWEALSPREQARVLQLLVQRVDYDGAKGKVVVTFHGNGIRAIGQDGDARRQVRAGEPADGSEMKRCLTA